MAGKEIFSRSESNHEGMTRKVTVTFLFLFQIKGRGEKIGTIIKEIIVLQPHLTRLLKSCKMLHQNYKDCFKNPVVTLTF